MDKEFMYLIDVLNISITESRAFNTELEKLILTVARKTCAPDVFEETFLEHRKNLFSKTIELLEGIRPGLFDPLKLIDPLLTYQELLAHVEEISDKKQ